ncbi:site-specific integrase [Cohnella sp. 56]|uniref:site-specific integrase n=1 Tax=Cohnella sp. 56 TaxID=3113722 RepID=UPI0030EABD04
MAYIRKRGKTWSYTIDIGRNPATGERRQETKSGFRTKEEAKSAAARAETEVADGNFVKNTTFTFKEFSKSWLEFYEATGAVKPGSVTVRKGRINKLNSYFGEARLRDISRMDYQNMLIDLKKKYSDETIISTHATAKMIFRRALELELLKSDPTKYSKVPRKQKTVEEIENGSSLPKYMEKEELAKFLNACKAFGIDKDYHVFMILAYTGIRIGELLALKWKDINFEEHTLSVTKTYQNNRNNVREFGLVPPKTAAGIRVIEFDKTIKLVLESQRSLLNKTKMKYRNKWYEGDFVFPNMRGRYPGYPDVQKGPEERMKKILEAANMKSDLTPHSLRHTHTTLLAEAGAALPEIMERLGHKDDKTTREIYLHVTKEMKKGAADKFSKLMSKVVTM